MILNLKELSECIEEYISMFPKTHTTIEDIVECLSNDYEKCGGSGLFGIQVSHEWENKCYGFEFRETNTLPVYEFVGMYKC